MTKLILSLIVVVSGIVLWLLKNHYSKTARIDKLEKERDTVNAKLEQAVYAGRGDLVNKLQRQRLQISKELNRLYR